jgi:hypothetical protein
MVVLNLRDGPSRKRATREERIRREAEVKRSRLLAK